MLKHSSTNSPVSSTTDSSGIGWGITRNFMSLTRVWIQKTQAESSNYKEAVTLGLVIKEFPQTVGMEAAHALVHLSIQKVGPSNDRFICVRRKSIAKMVLFSNTRPKFNGYGCSHQSLVEIGGLCKPKPTLTAPNSAPSSDGKYTDVSMAICPPMILMGANHQWENCV
ncbi:hypothetical protein AYI70_g3681 [Smittium culicis]|uniref:Uncharacterized protein n=1 Tax=Smittium culicis TaxID=133412 RepID=A0A1R1Y299_9FUNG|nr:hypothetical protein AYI70_g3681 [Smittium culicis]